MTARRPGRLRGTPGGSAAPDADIVEFDAAMTARRMDQSPGEEFLFPDLSPEEYARVKRVPKPS